MRNGVLLAFIMVLAGCTAASDPSSTAANVASSDQNPTASATAEIDSAQAETNETILRIEVTDEFDQPIPRAHIAVEGTELFGETNASGLLIFSEAPAGKHKIHITAEAFQAFTIEADVPKGLTTSIVAKLVPVEGLVAGNPHFHDYWGGQTEIVLFENLRWDITCVGYEYWCLEGGQPGGRYRGLNFPDGALVIPGTGNITFTVKWSQAGNAKLGLVVYMPGTPQSVTLPFTKSGDAATIALDPKRWDLPHAKSSRWSLQLCSCVTEYNGAWVGPFDISAKIMRGGFELPFDPPHPDYWGAATIKRMDERNASFGHVYAGSNLVTGAPGATPYPHTPYAFPEGRLVYPGAGEIVYRLWVNESASTGALVLDFNPHSYAAQTGAPDTWRQIAPKVDQRNYKEWRVAVDPAWYDDVYQSVSKWRWRIRPADLAGHENYHAYVGNHHVIVDLLKAS